MPDIPAREVKTLMAIGGESSQFYFYVPAKPTHVAGVNVVHDTPNFKTIQADSNYNWVAQQRLSRDPAMQFTGPGEETLSIEGILYPHLFGGFGTLQGLTEAGRRGDIMKLVMFSPLDAGMAGVIYPDNVVIRRIKRTHTHFLHDGQAAKIEFNLELVRYGDDSSTQTRFWNPNNNPQQPREPEPPQLEN